MKTQRVLIVGTSGCGKTVLAKTLARKFHISYYDLDDIYWLPNWQQRSDQEFIERVYEITLLNKWIICGNYTKIQQQILNRADCVIWLNYSLARCLWWTFKRSLKRIITHESISGSNYETFSRCFLNRNSLFIWILKTYHRRKQHYFSLYNTQQEKIIYLRFDSPFELSKWLIKLNI